MYAILMNTEVNDLRRWLSYLFIESTVDVASLLLILHLSNMRYVYVYGNSNAISIEYGSGLCSIENQSSKEATRLQSLFNVI